MSADNYVEVDHDGKQFIVRHGSASAQMDGDYEAPIVGRFDTEAQVEAHLSTYCIIEYGVDWLPAARAACAPQDTHVSYPDQIEELEAKVDSLKATLETACKTSTEWMEEAIAGRDTIDKLHIEIIHLQKTVKAQADREMDRIVRMNKAIFAAENIIEILTDKVEDGDVFGSTLRGTEDE